MPSRSDTWCNMNRYHVAVLALLALAVGAEARDCSRFFFKTNVPRVLLHADSGVCYWDHDVEFKYPKECTALGATTIPAFALNGQPLTTQQALASLVRGHDRAACCPDAVAYMRSKPPGMPHQVCVRSRAGEVQVVGPGGDEQQRAPCCACRTCGWPPIPSTSQNTGNGTWMA